MKGLCSQIAHSEDWPALKAVLFANIQDPNGFTEVKRSIDLIESMTEDETPNSPVIVNDKNQPQSSQGSAPAESTSGRDPDLEDN